MRANTLSLHAATTKNSQPQKSRKYDTSKTMEFRTFGNATFGKHDVVQNDRELLTKLLVHLSCDESVANNHFILEIYHDQEIADIKEAVSFLTGYKFDTYAHSKE